MDYNHEAKRILREHVCAYMSGVNAKYETNRDMMDDMYEECAFILTEYLIEGKYTPMQYNAIRNELGALIWKIFEPHIKAEKKLNL